MFAQPWRVSRVDRKISRGPRGTYGATTRPNTGRVVSHVPTRATTQRAISSDLHPRYMLTYRYTVDPATIRQLTPAETLDHACGNFSQCVHAARAMGLFADGVPSQCACTLDGICNKHFRDRKHCTNCASCLASYASYAALHADRFVPSGDGTPHDRNRCSCDTCGLWRALHPLPHAMPPNKKRVILRIPITPDYVRCMPCACATCRNLGD